MNKHSKAKGRKHRQELITLLQNFSNLRTGQDQVLWSVIGAFWTTNSLLLVSIFATNKEDRFYVGLIISLIGIYISWLWNRIQTSALSRIGSYEKSIKRIERDLNLDYELCSFLRADSFEYEKTINKKSARYVMQKFSKYVISIWIISAILFTGLFVFKTFCN